MRYRGYYQDAETELYYLNSRYYDSKLCRFLNTDEFSYLGANGDLQAYNLFAYCSNNPVMCLDDLATFWKELWEGVLSVVDIVVDVHEIYKNNITLEAGISVGVGVETDMGVLSVDAVSKADVVGIQIKDGEVRTGHPNKSSLRAGLNLAGFNVSAGPCNEGFESFDYSVRENEYSCVDVSFGFSQGFCYGIGFNYSASFSFSGFVCDLFDYIVRG